MALEAIHSFFFDTHDFATKVNFGHPWVPPALVLFYVAFCYWLGPALMRDRKPFKLKKTILAYNLTQVLVNAYIVIMLSKIAIKSFPMRCSTERHRFDDFYKAIIKEAALTKWHIYLIKFVDLLDAVFFILRGKEKQVTFLHVFHHVVICISIYYFINKYEVGYLVLITVLINTFIHVVMYTYYFLSAIGPNMQKYLWWKKYLTLLQMIQFVVIMLYMVISFSIGCDEGGIAELLLFSFVFALFILFFKFYKKSFKKE